MTEDAIAALERDTDALLKQARPEAYARMIAARVAHAGEDGFAPPPKQAPRSVVRERVLHVGEPLDSRQIEAMTGTLIADVFDRAMRTLALADMYAQTGWSVDIYTVASVQAVRSSRASDKGLPCPPQGHDGALARRAPDAAHAEGTLGMTPLPHPSVSPLPSYACRPDERERRTNRGLWATVRRALGRLDSTMQGTSQKGGKRSLAERQERAG
jgi:hypothetical protein